MTLNERRELASLPISWKGDLTDDCSAEWAGLMLRAEWMDQDYWWWAVYDLQNNDEIVDDSNNYEQRFIGGEVSRKKAEEVAIAFINKMVLL